MPGLLILDDLPTDSSWGDPHSNPIGDLRAAIRHYETLEGEDAEAYRAWLDHVRNHVHITEVLDPEHDMYHQLLGHLPKENKHD